MTLAKRFLTGVLFLSLSFMTACGANASSETAAPTSTAQDNTTTTVATPTDRTDTVKIEFWYGLGSVAGATMEEIIADFNASQDKVFVTGVQQPSYSDTYQKVQAAIAAQKPPAVFISSNMNDLAKKKALAALDSFMDDRTPIADYLEVFMDPATIDGKVYALPAYGTTQVIYYRKDLLKEAGIDPKKMYSTWENVYKYSKELQDKGIVEFGHLPMWGYNNLVDLALSSGGHILSDDGKTVTINTPQWIESWDFFRKQIHEDTISKVESGGQGWEYWYRTIDNVMNGTAISYTGSSGDKGDLDFEKIDSIPQPGFNGNDPHPDAGGLYLVVPAIASDEQKAAAYDWMAYFTSPETSARWSKAIGYIPVRKSANEVEEYKAFIEENLYAGVPFEQAQHGTPSFIDPTGGKILDALSIAADKVELENISAKEALDVAQKEAQKALDAVN